jgi:UDP-N-acetylmuramate-alanine ligase
MHHTYSRTKALYPQWLGAFEAADIVINHPIYSSARERADDSISGQQFAQDLAKGILRFNIFHILKGLQLG